MIFCHLYDKSNELVNIFQAKTQASQDKHHQIGGHKADDADGYYSRATSMTSFMTSQHHSSLYSPVTVSQPSASTANGESARAAQTLYSATVDDR